MLYYLIIQYRLKNKCIGIVKEVFNSLKHKHMKCDRNADLWHIRTVQWKCTVEVLKQLSEQISLKMLTQNCTMF